MNVIYKMKISFYIFIYHSRKNQTFKISYLVYITKMILNKQKKIIVQYKNTCSLKVTSYGYFKCFIKKLIGKGSVFIVFKKECNNVCMFCMCVCVFIYFILCKVYGVIVM